MGFGKDGKGVIMHSQDGSDALGTLGSGTAIKLTSTGPNALQEDFRLIKAELICWSKSIGGGEGPVLIGIADNELSVSEIAECIQSDLVDRNDRVSDERATRPVWILAQVDGGNTMPNNGMPVEKTIRWTFSNDEGFCLFAYNADNAALTGSPEVGHYAKFFGVWV